MNPINPVYPAYGYMPYNPMQPQQQRLAEMEQRYAQMQQPMQQPQMANYIKCRAVTSFDEAKASMIDLDGSIHIFADIGNGKIYTKQINLDGTATLKTYALDEPEPIPAVKPERQPEPIPDFVKHEELESVCRALNERISVLFDRIDDLSDEIAAPTKPEPKPKGGTKK